MGLLQRGEDGSGDETGRAVCQSLRRVQNSHTEGYFLSSVPAAKQVDGAGEERRFDETKGEAHTDESAVVSDAAGGSADTGPDHGHGAEVDGGTDLGDQHVRGDLAEN